MKKKLFIGCDKGHYITLVEEGKTFSFSDLRSYLRVEKSSGRVESVFLNFYHSWFVNYGKPLKHLDITMICLELHSNSIVIEADKKTMTEELKMDIF